MYNKRLSILSAIPRACYKHCRNSVSHITTSAAGADGYRFCLKSSVAVPLFQVRKMSRTGYDENNKSLNQFRERDGKVFKIERPETSLNNENSTSYVQAIQDLNGLQSNTQTLALAKYRNPQEILPLFAKQLASAGIKLDDLDKLTIVHVSGTKGKGSTCAFVDAILRCRGLKTGFYNSPHLVKVTERIRVNGEPLAEDKFSKYFRVVYDRLCEGEGRDFISMPTYFSFLTILAFHVFLEEKVDCAIVEVGIGGEYDPTNILRKPKVCGITSIHYDHINILGDTIESIAWSKAGIIKEGTPTFTIPQSYNKALDVIKSRAEEKLSPLHVCKPLAPVDTSGLGISGQAQYLNASLALHLSQYVLGENPMQSRRNISKSQEISWTELPHYARKALLECRWPGRCQILDYPMYKFFLDGAHTIESMNNCINWFQSKSVEQNVCRVLVVNIIGERNRREILEPLCNYDKFDIVIFSTNKISSDSNSDASEMFDKIDSTKGCQNSETMACCWNELTMVRNNVQCQANFKVPSVIDCLNWLRISKHTNADKKYHVLVTGSLHLVGAMLEALSITDMSLP